MKHLFIIAMLTLNTITFAQDSTVISSKLTNEFYLTVADFSPFNLHLKYKHQIGQRTFLKFGLVNLSASHVETLHNNPSIPPYRATNFSAGAEIGIEFRRDLSNKLTLFHGPNLRYSFATNSTGWQIPPYNPQYYPSHTASIPYTFGLLFNLTPNLLLAAEINPAINFTHTGSNNNMQPQTNQLNFGLDSRGGLLSLVFRF